MSPFHLDPPFRNETFLSKALTNPKTLERARWASCMLAFSSIGIAIASATGVYVASFTLIGIPLCVLAYKVDELYHDHLCREYNVKLVPALGGQNALDQIPLLDPPKGNIKKIKCAHFKERAVKGMQPNGQPFLAACNGKKVTVLYRDSSLKWRMLKDKSHQEISAERFEKIFNSL